MNPSNFFFKIIKNHSAFIVLVVQREYDVHPIKINPPNIYNINIVHVFIYVEKCVLFILINY